MRGAWLVDLLRELYPRAKAHATCLLIWVLGRAEMQIRILGPVCLPCELFAVADPFLGAVGAPRERSHGNVPAPHRCPDDRPELCRVCIGELVAKRRAGDV